MSLPLWFSSVTVLEKRQLENSCINEARKTSSPKVFVCSVAIYYFCLKLCYHKWVALDCNCL